MKLPFLLLALLVPFTACGDEGSGSSVLRDGAPNQERDAAIVIDEESRVAQYIRSTTYSKMVLEIDSVPGFEPRAAAQSKLLGQLDAILDKPEGITVVNDGTLVSRGEDHAWTDKELFALADENFDLAVDDETIKMHVLFIDGSSARDTNSGRILGLAWSNTHLVMFKQTIEDTCSSNLTPPLLRESLCERAEFSIWLHEVGHLLGLVNTGLSMVNDHQDEEHGAHDVSDACVMYWAYEGEAAVDVLRDRLIGGNQEALEFDAECLADIAAVRDAPRD